MIVRSIDAGWNIFFHEAHGLLAARIAESLAVNEDLPFWFEMKQAISVHDDHKVCLEWDSRNYVTEAGAPKDFTLISMDDRMRVAEAHAFVEPQRKTVGLDCWSRSTTIYSTAAKKHART